MKMKFGFGTIALVLAVLGYLTMQFRSVIVSTLSLPTLQMSDSKIDLTILYSLIFFIPAIVIGSIKKYDQDFGSKLGRILSLIVIVIMVISIVVLPMFPK